MAVENIKTQQFIDSICGNTLTSNYTHNSTLEHQELQYLLLLENILNNGLDRPDRTGVGTLSIFADNLKFSLRNGIIPLLTTKRVYWKGVVHELLFFLKGITHNKYLQDRKVHIWDGNTSREYLDSVGLNKFEEGTLGANYGFAWRHFGADYVDSNTDYTGKGIDQVKEVIDLIKNNPTSRRIIITGWNPAQQHLMCLPSCHCFMQFYVDTQAQELHCQMYQRSVDVFLGLPFNIASYALLTNIIADVCGLKPGTLSMCLGDTHIYKNHIEQCKTQLERMPRDFPKLEILRHRKNPWDYEFEDFSLKGYNPHPTIKGEMAT